MRTTRQSSTRYSSTPIVACVTVAVLASALRRRPFGRSRTKSSPAGSCRATRILRARWGMASDPMCQ